MFVATVIKIPERMKVLKFETSTNNICTYFELHCKCFWYAKLSEFLYTNLHNGMMILSTLSISSRDFVFSKRPHTNEDSISYL